MDYSNIYPLDKIYSQATGVGCPVTAASVADTKNEPVEPTEPTENENN